METLVIWLMSVSGSIVELVIDREAHSYVVYQMVVSMSFIDIVACLLAYWPLWHLKKRKVNKGEA